MRQAAPHLTCAAGSLKCELLVAHVQVQARVPLPSAPPRAPPSMGPGTPTTRPLQTYAPATGSSGSQQLPTLRSQDPDPDKSGSGSGSQTPVSSGPSAHKELTILDVQKPAVAAGDAAYEASWFKDVYDDYPLVVVQVCI